MIWLSWRQHRRHALATLVGLAALACLLIPTGLAMRHTFDDLGLAGCFRAAGKGTFVHGADVPESCATAMHQFDDQYRVLDVVGVLLALLPLLVGLFWGAPLVAREVEHGTHRLVWTQGVSRRRWLLTQFGLVGALTVAAAAVYGLGTSWWSDPLRRVGHGRLEVLRFDVQGVVPVGYTLFAVALGVAAGTVWRRMLPAMAVTLAGYVGVRIALTALARPHYLSPKTLRFPVEGVSPALNPANGDWVIAENVRNAAGRIMVSNAQMGCPPKESECLARLGHGAYNWEAYQPGSRFWLFQGIETGIFVALAALLVYVAVRRLPRIA